MSLAPLAILPPRLFAEVAYYELIAQYQAVYIDYDVRYNKREKAVHRYDIADTRGRLSMTVPVSKPQGFTTGKLRWSDVQVSAHGRWWEVQQVALESAYGGTPFFEYYYDRFRPLFEARPLADCESITGLCRRADDVVRSILNLRTYFLTTIPEGVPYDDYRNSPIPPAEHSYRQVRADQLGFISGLSILDRIFNEGR